MEFSVRHSMPGRVRLSVPALCHKRSLAEAFLGWIGGQSGIKTARINYDCASLVLEYDPAHEPLLRALLERFQTRKPGRHQVAGREFADGASTGERQSACQRFRNVSRWRCPRCRCLMAFSANPVVVGVNLPLMLWNAMPIAERAWKVWDNERRLNIDVLDTLAITLSILQGVPMAGCIVTWLIKLGDWIRDLTAAGSRRAINELLEFQSKSAWVLRDGVVVAIAGQRSRGRRPRRGLSGRDDLGGWRDRRRPRDHRPEDHHRRRSAGHQGGGRGCLCRDRHSRRPDHGAGAAGRLGDDRRPDRAPG